MTDLYLIAHRVRNEPAFDIATRMQCPVCEGYPYGGYPEDLDNGGCHECDSLGYWWIIPTSGHRAYPWASTIHVCHADGSISFKFPPGEPGSMPEGLPDHYPNTISPTPAIDLVVALGLIEPSATKNLFPRRL